jgi:hypothetical protein
VDTANFSPEQRVDLADLQFAAQNSQLGFVQELCQNFAVGPSNTGAIIDGFVLSNPSGNQIQVTRGSALLGQRSGLQVRYGVMVASGDATQSIDVSSFGQGTYGVYIKFDQSLGAYENRTFWQNSGTAGEYAQTTPTRLLSGWAMTITGLNPGAEWLRIGQVTTPANTLVDMRPLYFEGRPDQSFASGWGTTPSDRSDDRATYGIGDLQTFTAAMRTAIEDIKGPGLVRWWQPMLGGQNIGFTASPTLGRTAWGDARFYAQGDADAPTVQFDTKAGITYRRSTSTYTTLLAGLASPVLQQSATATQINPALGINTAPSAPLHVAGSGVLALLDTTGTPQANAQLQLLATGGYASVLFAAGSATPAFEMRGTQQTLGTYAGATLVGSADTTGRWLFGPQSAGYAYPTRAATVTVADTTGNFLLRLDSSGKSGVNATMSLRANGGTTGLNFTPNATSASAAATYAMTGDATSFSLLDMASGTLVYSYTLASKTLTFGATTVGNYTTTQRTMSVYANTQNFYIPSSSSMTRANDDPTTSAIAVQGSGGVNFPLNIPSGCTITNVRIRISRTSSATQTYTSSIALYGTPISNPNAATTGQKLAGASRNMTPGIAVYTSFGTGSINIDASLYTNYVVVFGESDPSAGSYISAVIVDTQTTAVIGNWN